MSDAFSGGAGDDMVCYIKPEPVQENTNNKIKSNYFIFLFFVRRDLKKNKMKISLMIKSSFSKMLKKNL